MNVRILKARAVTKTLIGNLVSRWPFRRVHTFTDPHIIDGIDTTLLADPDALFTQQFAQDYADYKARLEAYNNDTSGPDLYRTAGLM